MRSSAASALVTVALSAALLALSAPLAVAAPAPSAAQPSASLSSVDCASGGVYANLNNTGTSPAAFAISVDGGAWDTVELDGSAPGESRLVPLPEDKSSTVAIAADGMATVTTTLMRDCVVAGTAMADVAAATTAPTPREAGARDAAPTLDDAATGPFSDVPLVAWVAVAAVLVLLAGALLRRGRRPERGRVPAR